MASTPYQHYHSHQHHLPPPPPLPSTTATSTTMNEISNSNSVLAARGRKRKRLQKACTACHRAKRRCDGGLPCSNCDFSGRLCCYGESSTAAGGAPSAAAAATKEQSSAVVPSTTTIPQHQHQHQHPSAPQPGQHQHFLHPAAVPVTPSYPSINQAYTRDYRPVHHHQHHQHPSTMPSPVASGSIPLPPSHVPMSSGFHFHPPGPSHINTAPTMSPPHSTVDTLLSPNGLTPSQFAAAAALPSKAERKELISTFFNRVHPYSALFDEMSFLRELAMGESPVQLWPMYALAARFLPPSSASSPATLAGEKYAAQTRLLFHTEDGIDTAGTLDRAYMDFLDRPDSTTANHLFAITQTALLLSAYELGTGKHHAAMQHSSACIRLLVGSGLHRSNATLPSGMQPLDELTRSRLVSVAFTHDVILAALADQAATVRRFDFELAGLTGPGDGGYYKMLFSRRKQMEMERTSTERLTLQLESLARAAGIFGHTLELRKQQNVYATEPTLGGGASTTTTNLSEEINRLLCEWSNRLEEPQTFCAENVQRHGAALWSVQEGSGGLSPKEWTAEHGASLSWALMHTLCECSSLLAKSATRSESDLAGLQSARSNLVLLLENMHLAGRNSLLSLLPMLYAQQVGSTIAVATAADHHRVQQVDSWINASLSSLWVMKGSQVRKAVGVLAPVTVVGSSYRASYNGGLVGGSSSSTSTARSPLPRTLPSVHSSANNNNGNNNNNNNNDGNGAAALVNSTRPTLAGTKRTYSATSSTSPHLHTLAQLGSPPMSSSTTSPHNAAANNAAATTTSSSSTTSPGSTSSGASTVSSAASSSSGGRSPPPPPPVLPVSGVGAGFKTNTLPPLISFGHHKHRA
ncbi:hypothetical protein CF319_g3837 [Tilletia indica]|nr:hypothetical protein CF319_g3837 [Tilletia indica]